MACGKSILPHQAASEFDAVVKQPTKIAQHLHDKLKHEAWQVERLPKARKNGGEALIFTKDAEHKRQTH